MATLDDIAQKAERYRQDMGAQAHRLNQMDAALWQACRDVPGLTATVSNGGLSMTFTPEAGLTFGGAGAEVGGLSPGQLALALEALPMLLSAIDSLLEDMLEAPEPEEETG